MTAGPLVSVVIPTWNRKALLDEAIASVFAQTYGRWELVVADDGSTDGTVEALRAAGDPRIRIVPLGHGGNVARVRNAGVARASGSLIAFLDADDLWLPRKLEWQVAALGGGSARWCYANYAHVDALGRPLDRSPTFRPDSGFILRSLLGDETAACICTVMVERALFDSIGGFDESLVREDLDFELRLAAVAKAVALPEVVALVRDHAHRTTRAMTHPHEASARVFEEFLARETDDDLRSIARARWARLVADAGLVRLTGGDPRTGLRLLRTALGAGESLGYIMRGMASTMARRSR